MTKYIAKVQHPGLAPYWVGNFEASSRAEAKKEARKFVAQYVPTDCKIVCIAAGFITIYQNGPEIPIDEP